MPLLDKLPKVTNCCGCVTDIKTAAAIIAVLGIVTTPALSWAVVRHTYVIRVACFLTSSTTRPDVVDINLQNVLSFGFGANAGLGPSCLVKNKTSTVTGLRTLDKEEKETVMVNIIRHLGWMILVIDMIFVVTSVNFLIKMFQGQDQGASKKFMIAAIISVLMSFMYGMFFVATCIFIGGSFPIFEFIFSVSDLIMWSYFLIVVHSYRRRSA